MAMTLAPKPPTLPRPSAAGPTPWLWTVEQFNSIGELGVFEGRRAMLVHGIILEQGPMNPPHAIALELVDAVVRRSFATGWRVRIQLPLILGRHIDPEPDVAIVAGSPRDSKLHPTTASLVIEVSDSTLQYDTTTKVDLYVAAAIPEYWVLDLNARTLRVYRDPGPDGAGDSTYRTQFTLTAADAITPLAGAGSLAVADLLP